MCDVLQIPRSTYYYEAKHRDNNDEELTTLIVDIFKKIVISMVKEKSKRNLPNLAGLCPAVVLAES